MLRFTSLALISVGLILITIEESRAKAASVCDTLDEDYGTLVQESRSIVTVVRKEDGTGMEEDPEAVKEHDEKMAEIQELIDTAIQNDCDPPTLAAGHKGVGMIGDSNVSDPTSVPLAPGGEPREYDAQYFGGWDINGLIPSLLTFGGILGVIDTITGSDGAASSAADAAATAVTDPSELVGQTCGEIASGYNIATYINYCGGSGTTSGREDSYIPFE